MNCKVAEGIKHVHQAWGPKIIVMWLQDMYLQLGLSPKTVRFFIREQRLIDSSERLRVLRLECKWHLQCCEEARWQECWWTNMGQHVLVRAQANKASCLLIWSQLEMHLWLRSYRSMRRNIASASKTKEAWRWVQWPRYGVKGQQCRHGREDEGHYRTSQITLWCCKSSFCKHQKEDIIV